MCSNPLPATAIHSDKGCSASLLILYCFWNPLPRTANHSNNTSSASLLLQESFASDSKPFQQHLFSFLAAAPPTAHHSDACCAAADLLLEPFAAHGKAVPILSFPRAALPPKRVNMHEGVYTCIYIYTYINIKIRAHDGFHVHSYSCGV